ncbi:hypothetical protein ACSBR2_009522 [Camellia fascicularis]
MSSSKKITLKSSDGEAFEVEESVALESQTIKHMIEDDCAHSVIPLPNVTSKILAKVIEYCKKHVQISKTQDRSAEVDLKTWDSDFVKVDQPTLFDLILAANYLNIKSLLDLTCQTVADMIKGKTPEEIRKTFNIKNDFSADEEEELDSGGFMHLYFYFEVLLNLIVPAILAGEDSVEGCLGPGGGNVVSQLETLQTWLHCCWHMHNSYSRPIVVI